MERDSKFTPAYMEELFNRVERQIEVSKNLIEISKGVIAQSKEHYQQHAVETEIYMDSMRNRK